MALPFTSLNAATAVGPGTNWFQLAQSGYGTGATGVQAVSGGGHYVRYVRANLVSNPGSAATLTATIASKTDEED